MRRGDLSLIYEKTPLGEDLVKFIDKLRMIDPDDKRDVDVIFKMRRRFRRKWKRDPFNLIFKAFGEGAT